MIVLGSRLASIGRSYVYNRKSSRPIDACFRTAMPPSPLAFFVYRYRYTIFCSQSDIGIRLKKTVNDQLNGV